MMEMTKEITEAHFKVLFQELSRLETDCKILREWAEDRKFLPAKTLAILIEDSLDSLGLHLSDFKSLLQEGKTV